ncbi:MAG: hypothetical protein ACK4P1_12895, partial [Aggregatilineales bacterium]
GSPLAFIPRLWLGLALGLLGIGLFVADGLLLWRWRAEWLRVWAVLAFFSALSALVTAYGRWFHFDGVSAYPLADRYVTNGVPFWLALVAVSASNLRLARQSAPLSLEGLPRAIAALIGWLRRHVQRLNGVMWAGLGASFALSLILAQVRYLPDEKPVGECLRTLPLTRDFECAVRLGAGKSNFLPVLARADQLAVRHLGVFAQEPAVELGSERVAVPLEYIGDGTPSGESPDSRFTTWRIGGEAQRVFLQQPPATQDWTIWFQHVGAPTYFEAALYVAPSESAQSVTFRLYGQALSHGLTVLEPRRLLLEARYNPRERSEPMPTRVSLAPFLNRSIRLMLLLETEGTLGAQAMWIAPRLVLELSEEAARA